jgi:hypothetical protein
VAHGEDRQDRGHHSGARRVVGVPDCDPRSSPAAHLCFG